jgi:hypothetical protein
MPKSCCTARRGNDKALCTHPSYEEVIRISQLRAMVKCVEREWLGICCCGLRPGQRPGLSCFRRFDTYTWLPRLTLSSDVRAKALTVARRRCREVVVGL